MTSTEVLEGIERLTPWYHSVDLGFTMTPGEPYDEIWDNIRAVLPEVDYRGKIVLDLGTFDGMWAFEAERMGAKLVVATDCNWEAQERFLFCREVLNSKVVPVFGVAVHRLREALDFYLQGWNVRWRGHSERDGEPPNGDPRFDVVQHFGLFFHLLNPALSLLQCRSVMKEGGTLLIETAFLPEEERPVMLFNNYGTERWNIYDDSTTWWAPSRSCLDELLRACCFSPTGLVAILGGSDWKIHRICLAATALPLTDVHPAIVGELRNKFRTPGLDLP